jgi:carboxyl-terminal processing protease
LRIEKPNKKFVLNSLILLGVFGGGFIIGQNENQIINRFKYGDNSQNNSLPSSLDYSGVEEVYAKLKNSFDGELDANKIEDGLKEGLVEASGDSFTEYLNDQDSKDFEEGLNGSFEGIGAELGKEEDSIIVISPISGFPAEKAGLRAQDVIVEIDGEPAFDLSVSEAVKKIRGPKGTKVKLGVVRDGNSLDFEITRAQITIASVTKELSGDVGIIKISRFGNDTTSLTRQYAKELVDSGAKKVILDLRGNPGGLLNSAVEVASVWLPKGTKVLEEKRGDKTVKEFGALGNPLLQGIPTVVLIDAGSASASEIVAGALSDNKAAKIIGKKSFGKGSVQEVIELKDGGSLKVTIARWFTPAGRNIDKEGIEPDKKVEISEEDAKAKKDPQKSAALSELRN